MGNWEIAILKCINGLGNEAMLPQIYRKLGDYILLTNKHKEGSPLSGRPMYQHGVRSVISKLCQKGDLIRVNRGCYSLTRQGGGRI
jgi:hypothetical protein